MATFIMIETLKDSWQKTLPNYHEQAPVQVLVNQDAVIEMRQEEYSIICKDKSVMHGTGTRIYTTSGNNYLTRMSIWKLCKELSKTE